MYSLDTTSTSLRVVSSGASGVTVTVSGVLITPTVDTPFTVSSLITGTAEALAAPAASQQKTISNITIHAGAGATSVAMAMVISATERTLVKATLAFGESLVYENGKGWAKIGLDGNLIIAHKTAQAAPSLLVQSIAYNRTSLATMVIGQSFSTWRGSGFPAQGAVPAAAAVCTNVTAGAFPLLSRSGSQKRRLIEFSVQAANVNTAFEVEDRLAHMGGLNGTLTTAQAVGLDLSAIASANLAERIGSPDYSEVDWFLEWYTATGATVATPTINVTYFDGTTGNCSIWNSGLVILPASVAAARRYQIISANGKGIRHVNTVTLSASTATAGSFGVTARRKLVKIAADPLPYRSTSRIFTKDVARIIPDQACLTIAGVAMTTTSGVASGLLVQDVAEI